MKFTKEHHAIWKTLFRNQIGNVIEFACKEYLEGFKILNLPDDRVPSLSFLNSKITPLTGWKIIRTKIRYSDTLPWYQHFARKEFIITNYLRSWKELDFTPEPDMFHDLFGHLPFLTLTSYAELFDLFTAAYFKGNDKERETIKRLAWFSYEFGLIKENCQIKLFGTGLISSRGETAQVTTGNTQFKPYTIDNVLRRNKAIASFNKELFVFESLDALKTTLTEYFSTFKGRYHLLLPQKGKIVDHEMDLNQY